MDCCPGILFLFEEVKMSSLWILLNICFSTAKKLDVLPCHARFCLKIKITRKPDIHVLLWLVSLCFLSHICTLIVGCDW
ncbi:hypothetical protein Peur_055476 [Populus x canadensis]